MNRRCLRQAIVFGVAVLPFAATLTSRATSDVLNKKCYVSPSGEYKLIVDPSDMDGAGEAEYTFMNDEVLWCGHRDYTLWDAVVTDEGFVAGYAYEDGLNGYRHGPNGDYTSNILITVINPAGIRAMQERRPRRTPPTSSNPPSPFVPTVDDIFVDSNSGRFIVCVSDRRVQWWVYRLFNGVHAEDVTLDHPQDGMRTRLLSAESIPGTSLFLAHWVVGPSARCSVLDAQFREIWGKEIDYERDAAVRGSQIQLGERQFSLTSTRRLQTVTYEVVQDERGADQWLVFESARTPHHPQAVADRMDLLDVPAVELALHGTFDLAPDDGQGEHASDGDDQPHWIWHIVAGDENRFYVKYTNTSNPHVFNGAGQRIRVVVQPPDAMRGLICATGDGELYVRLRRPLQPTENVLYLGKGERTGVPLAGRQKWMFKPGTRERWVIGSSEVFLVDATGEVAQRIRRDAAEQWFERLWAAAVAPDGRLAVLSYSRGRQPRARVNVLSSDGTVVRTIPLEWEHEMADVAFSGQWIITIVGQQLLLYDAEQGSVRRFQLPGQQDGEMWRSTCSPDGSEIWVWRYGSTTVLRYALPLRVQ